MRSVLCIQAKEKRTDSDSGAFSTLRDVVPLHTVTHNTAPRSPSHKVGSPGTHPSLQRRSSPVNRLNPSVSEQCSCSLHSCLGSSGMDLICCSTTEPQVQAVVVIRHCTNTIQQTSSLVSSCSKGNNNSKLVI